VSQERRAPHSRLRSLISHGQRLQRAYLAIFLMLVLLIGVGSAMFLIARTIPSSTEPTATATQDTHRGVIPKATREVWRLWLPLIARLEPSPSAAALPSPTPDRATIASTPSPTSQRPSPTPPPVDFDAVRADLRAQGQDLAFVKIGFHVGPGGNREGLEEYLETLADAGVPAFIKSVDDYSFCVQALDYNLDNITVFRLTGGSLEQPDRNLPAEISAEQHWARILEALPPEFDRRTWLEVMNEPGRHRPDWLGRFALRTAQLALRDGYRFAAFGWTAGQPEPEDWETPEMLEFLYLASQHPAQIGIALHEYSFAVEDIAHLYPDLVGRFQALFRICDRNDIPHPTVLITEWGWESRDVPPVDQAMADIAWASRLYSAYPQVQGAAIWYLGGGFDIADQAQRLIAPLGGYATTTYFVVGQD
jgi:hypothetical protein